MLQDFSFKAFNPGIRFRYSIDIFLKNDLLCWIRHVYILSQPAQVFF